MKKSQKHDERSIGIPMPENEMSMLQGGPPPHHPGIFNNCPWKTTIYFQAPQKMRAQFPTSIKITWINLGGEEDMWQDDSFEVVIPLHDPCSFGSLSVLEDFFFEKWTSWKDLYNWQFFVTFLGWLSDPFQWLSDLQLGDEKVTLNHLV